MPPPHPDPRERGAALLTVLLLVAVISVIAGTALEKLHVSTRLAGNAAALEQARAFALAAETLAIIRIDTLQNQDQARTTLAGDWEGRPMPLPLPEGSATLTAVDGGNCFNLNGLVSGTAGAYVAVPVQVDQFAALMRLVGVPGGEAQGIAAAAADWIDSDQAPLPGGAEDAAYTGGDPSYRTPGTLMADASELRAVAGVTPDIWRQIAPWVCTLPRAQPSSINVNTLLPEQAPLLSMLSPDTLDPGKARAILLARPGGGYSSSIDFLHDPTVASAFKGSDGGGQIGVRTSWFALTIDVALGGAELHQTALVDARGARARVVSRAWGDPA